MTDNAQGPIHRQATRARAEALMCDFVPRMGQRYTERRGLDAGPGMHVDVSTLSPFIRRRLLLERDLVAAALDAHGPEAAQKFVQEVIWRGYFKGWLERRPMVWDSYRDGLARALTALERDDALRRVVECAETGQIGLDCFDAWARELVQTGYLHNHARMWFASIWIFTLGLPWRIGADFFLRHLLDGDPASNTLSWRWVAGLHTRGKPYEAQAWNIAKFTGGRYAPREAHLAAGVQGLDDEEPDGLPPVSPLRSFEVPQTHVPTALLITEEDCRVEDFSPERLDIRVAASLRASHLRSPRAVAEHVANFEATALDDTAARLGQNAEPLHADTPCDLARWAERSGAWQIATPYVPAGPLRDWLRQAEPDLKMRGITLCEWRRDWDAAIWPHATAGYFKVKSKIPEILERASLS